MSSTISQGTRLGSPIAEIVSETLDPTDPAPTRHRRERIDHWNNVARRFADRRWAGRYYRRRVQQTLSHVIPAGQRVLELGCGRGNLLAALKPSVGLGVDFSEEMIAQAASLHADQPTLRFVVADAHELAIEEKFDFIVLSDLAFCASLSVSRMARAKLP